ncbi:preprotein translocase subunit SecE [Patescibacteria group bacterium]|nr:MAG: preprotein translocase subunit SecE [Patescibacteria group bacterium]
MSWKDNPIGKYLSDSRDELAKVVWPSRQQIINHSLLVIGISLGVAIYFGLIDVGLSRAMEMLIAKFR